MTPAAMDALRALPGQMREHATHLRPASPYVSDALCNWADTIERAAKACPDIKTTFRKDEARTVMRIIRAAEPGIPKGRLEQMERVLVNAAKEPTP